MKSLMLILVLFTLPALGDDTYNARWYVLKAMSNSGVLKDEDVKASVAKVEEAEKPIGRETAQELCGNRARYEFDPIGVADKVEHWFNTVYALHVAELVILDQKLAEKGTKAEVDERVERATANVIDRSSEFIENLRSGVVDLKVFLDNTCKAENLK